MKTFLKISGIIASALLLFVAVNTVIDILYKNTKKYISAE